VCRHLGVPCAGAYDPDRVNPELDALVSADEDARVRLAAAEEAARAQVASVREALARERDERKRSLAEALERELEAIRETSARRLQERRIRREQYRAQRARAAESLLPVATDAFVRLVRGDGAEQP
jgi:hypothetical protein